MPSKTEHLAENHNGPNGDSPPPAYSAESHQPDTEHATAAFANLNLDPEPNDPTASYCLVHLKLLHTFQTLKEDIGYTDGLWGLWNSRATEGVARIHGHDDKGKITEEVKDVSSDHEARQTALSQVREKRWALYVARAADRYESWWKSMFDGPPLNEEDQEMKASDSYRHFPSVGGMEPSPWTKDKLPPLDVLMVWHSHMLNPRAYLEDCMRAGLRQLWWRGMPWDLINEVIDDHFNYHLSDAAVANWIAKTDRPWENTEDASHKTIDCPMCNTRLSIPWTTCGVDEDAKTPSSLVGSGYGDGELDFACHGCNCIVTGKLLSVAKFCKDSRDLLLQSIPMPGTILDPRTGKPDPWEPRYPSGIKKSAQNPLTLPNRLIKQVLRIRIQELMRPPQYLSGSEVMPTMEDVRVMVEEALMNPKVMRDLTDHTAFLSKTNLTPVSRFAVRKMMSRYWDNFSSFALDLSSAVIRQGIFVDKMYRLDWLSSPVASQTMDRIYLKYTRFLSMMRTHSDKLCVPTLDVDLAWHTHQTMPASYYVACTGRGGTKFIDHDDKIREDKLSEAFEWTSKVYQENFNEVYSECTCWYCETVRASHISAVGRVLKMSGNEKIAENFHESGAAKLCPPDNSAHISTHNAVTTTLPDEANTINGRLAFNSSKSAFKAHQKRLDANYEKARKRAEKKGRKLPPKEDYYNHWGSHYYMYGPWMPLYFTPGLYYGAPGSLTCNESGGHGGCAAGSCGGSVAAGACGGAGGCAGGGCGGGGGGCGGGGGGCGGGGGGGCGGGGGGC